MPLDEKVVYDHLKFLGVPPHLKGYYFLKSAIVYTSRLSILAISATDIYSHVATVYKCTSSQVERCIRTAIEFIFANTNPEILVEYFGNTVGWTTGKVTNKHFIFSVIEYITCNSGAVATTFKNTKN